MAEERAACRRRCYLKGWPRRPRHTLNSFLLVAASFVLAACAVENADRALTIGAFTAVDRIEEELQRGVSTKADVERILGKPNGSGAAFLDGSGAANLESVEGLSGIGEKREIWLYEDHEGNIIDSKGGVVRIHLRQQYLTVYFLGDRFDGFMWFSNAGTQKVKTPSSLTGTK